MGRPKTPILSTAIIADAALALIDETGTFQVVTLAKRLKVAPSSLYNHVTGRADVVELIRGRIAEEFDFPDPSAEWKEAVRNMLTSLRDVYSKHPRAVPILFELAVQNGRTLEAYESFARTLIAAGFAPRTLVPLISMIDAHALGLAFDLVVPDELWKIDLGSPAATPSLKIALQEHERHRSEEVARLSADVIVAGMEHLLQRLSTESL